MQAYATRLYLWALNSSRYFSPHKARGDSNGYFTCAICLTLQAYWHSSSSSVTLIAPPTFSSDPPDVLEGRPPSTMFQEKNKTFLSSPHIIWLYADVKRVLYKTRPYLMPLQANPMTRLFKFFFSCYFFLFVNTTADDKMERGDFIPPSIYV